MKTTSISLTFPQLYRFSKLSDKEIKAANRTGNLAYQAECYELKSIILYAMHQAEKTENTNLCDEKGRTL